MLQQFIICPIEVKVLLKVQRNFVHLCNDFLQKQMMIHFAEVEGSHFAIRKAHSF